MAGADGETEVVSWKGRGIHPSISEVGLAFPTYRYGNRCE